jgi:hypothetical protein
MAEADRQAIEGVLRDSVSRRPKLVSITDFGAEVGVGRTTAYQLVEAGEVETVYIGARRLVVADSIDNYVERLREKAGAL